MLQRLVWGLLHIQTSDQIFTLVLSFSWFIESLFCAPAEVVSDAFHVLPGSCGEIKQYRDMNKNQAIKRRVGKCDKTQQWSGDSLGK